MAYRLTELARSQIIDSYEYGYFEFGEAQAEKYFHELHHCFELLSDNPRLARLHENFDPPVRIHFHGSHYIVYRIADRSNDIEIFAVIRKGVALGNYLAKIL